MKQRAMNDPYEVLGIESDASEEEIKTAYRKLARQFHPDSNPGQDAMEKMSQINKAYERLQAMRQSGETEAEMWDFEGFSFENKRSMEEYSPGRRRIFQNAMFRRVVLLLVIGSMLGVNLLMTFYQAYR